MNKRKAKKQIKKCFTPLIDNFGCLSMSDSERKMFNKAIKRYCLQHFSYKHYKDEAEALNRALQHQTIHAPTGPAIQWMRDNKKIGITSVIVFQNEDQLKDACMYLY